MTKKITFTGHSDDLFCASINDSLEDEIYIFDDKAIYTIENETERMLVIGEYMSGCWCIGVSQYDENTPIPNWNISLSQSEHCEYSPTLTITCPDETFVINNR